MRLNCCPLDFISGCFSNMLKKKKKKKTSMLICKHKVADAPTNKFARFRG